MEQVTNELTRSVYWNISNIWLMYVGLGITFIIFGYGIYRYIRFWRMGKTDADRFGNWGSRIWFLLRDGLFQRKVLKKWYPGVFHIFIFWSFLFLALVTAIITVQEDLVRPLGLLEEGENYSLFTGWFYVFFSLGADLAGALVIVGILMAAARRYLKRPETITHSGSNTFMIVLLFVIIVSGFILEGMRLAWSGDPDAQIAWIHPIGYAVSLMFTGITEAGTQQAAFAGFWWGHMLSAFALIALLPYTKFFHIMAIPINVFFTSSKPRGALRREDIEEVMESADMENPFWCVGNCTPLDFTWKQLLDFDSCIGCGRCEAVCPAATCGQPFSPKTLIENLRDFAHEHLEKLKKPATPEEAIEARDEALLEGTTIVGNALEEDFIWFCRTCLACVEACPANIEHLGTIIDIRRSEVMMQSRIPADAGRAIKTLERLGNPFGPQDERSEWIEKLNVPIAKPGDEVDYLYFIGCCTTFDPVKQKIGQDTCRVLSALGISYGLLGDDEKCCGDPARVLGDENMFQAIAKEQYELINTRKFKKLLVSCPHCYNVFKNDYADFGHNFDVIHHTELFSDLMDQGKIPIKKKLNEKVVYHDPCYMGRYNNIYDPPRNILNKLGVNLIEIDKSKYNSFCCGAGGGHYYMDLIVGERINNVRVNQLYATGASKIATGCAYCNQMLTDSVLLNDLEEKIQVVDIAVLLAEAMGLNEDSQKQKEAASAPSEKKEAAME